MFQGKFCLIDNWKRVALRACSIRLTLLSAIFTAAEVILPLLSDVLPTGLFVLLAFGCSICAAVARLIAQPELRI